MRQAADNRVPKPIIFGGFALLVVQSAVLPAGSLWLWELVSLLAVLPAIVDHFNQLKPDPERTNQVHWYGWFIPPPVHGSLVIFAACAGATVVGESRIAASVMLLFTAVSAGVAHYVINVIIHAHNSNRP